MGAPWEGDKLSPHRPGESSMHGDSRDERVCQNAKCGHRGDRHLIDPSIKRHLCCELACPCMHFIPEEAKP